MSKQLLTHPTRFSRALSSRSAITPSSKPLVNRAFSTRLASPLSSSPSPSPSNIQIKPTQQTTYSTLARYHATQNAHSSILQHHSTTLHEIRTQLQTLESHTNTLDDLRKQQAKIDAKIQGFVTHRDTLQHHRDTLHSHGSTLRDHTSTLHELRLHKARMDATIQSLEAHRDTLHSLEMKRITDTSKVRSDVHWAKMQAILVATVVVVVGMTAWKVLAAEVGALRREVGARRG